jgi:N-acylneuraminate cytidylyltransferase
MNNIAIIPARGGSKRIPRKNIKEFCGKPIIAYSIEAALKSNLFSEIMVSTEDEEIADISIKQGAKVPFLRSMKNADDFTGPGDVMYEVFERITIKEICVFDNVCCVYATASI